MLQTIFGIIGALGGITGVGSLLYMKQERKSKELDNESKIVDIEKKRSEEWQKLYEEERDSAAKFREYHDEEIKERDAKIDAIYAEISNQRNQKVELHNKIAEMTVELTKLKMLKCEVANCINRQPPTGY